MEAKNTYPLHELKKASKNYQPIEFQANIHSKTQQNQHGQKNQQHGAGSVQDTIPSQDNREVSRINRKTPLLFRWRCNGGYLISYRADQFWPVIGKTVAWALFNYFLSFLLQSFDQVSEEIKYWINIVLIVQIVLFVLLSIIDAGTVFEDEDETYLNEERTYCTTCQVYKLSKTKHCVFCNKCVKKYDHHCGVFGKCIGKQNICIFWGFLMLVGMEMPAMMIIIIYQLLAGMQGSNSPQ